MTEKNLPLTEEQASELETALSTEVVDSTESHETLFPLAWKKVTEDQDYVTYLLPDGTYERKMKYEAFSSIEALTQLQKLSLIEVQEGAEEMKANINKEILVEGLIIEPYTSLIKETGQVEHGATTTFITDGFSKAIVTSSKTVYVKIREYMKILGSEMFNEGDQITVMPIQIPGRERGRMATSIKLVTKQK